MTHEPETAPPKHPHRAWCFTVFNPTEEAEEALRQLSEKDTVVRCTIGREVCPTSGTPHLQGYLRLARAVRFTGIRKLLPPGSHIEARRSSKECEATAYCLKDGNVFIDKGFDCDTTDSYSSRAAEALAIISEIDSGETYASIYTKHRLFCFFNRKFVLDQIADRLGVTGSNSKQV